MDIRLRVVCAVTLNFEKKILAAQRSIRMPLPFKWEFPGGKVEDDEQETMALQRELQEELRFQPLIVQSLPVFTYRESGREIILIPFLCWYDHPDPVQPVEHEAVEWLSVDELRTLDWAEADLPLVDFIQESWETLLLSLPANQKNAG